MSWDILSLRCILDIQEEAPGEVWTENTHLKVVSVGIELGKGHLHCSHPCSPVPTLGDLKTALNLEKAELARILLLCNQDYRCQQLKIKEVRLFSVLGNGYRD